jgi:hypothetical protein
MDKWEDYPIKVLDIASLIMVTLPMVSSLSSGGVLAGPRCPPPLYGCFLRVERSSLQMISLLFFRSSLWTTSRVNGSLCEWRRLHVLRGPNHLGEGPSRPAQAHFGLIRSPLRTHGSSWHFALCPLQLHHLDDVILASKMEGLLAWSSVFYASILGGCSFVTLWSLPPLGVILSCSQTRTGLLNCSFELGVPPYFMSMFSCKNITLPNAHTKMNLLYH